VEVNPDNFDSVLEGMKPHLNYSVENKLSEEPDAPNLKVDLRFKSMDDFEPENVARQVKPLKATCWTCAPGWPILRGSLQGNDKLEELLLDAVGNTEKLDKLKGEMGKGGIQWLIHRPRLRRQPLQEQVLEKDFSIRSWRKGASAWSRPPRSAARTWSRNSSPRSSMAP
jgi:hypothetical protein